MGEQTTQPRQPQHEPRPEQVAPRRKSFAEQSFGDMVRSIAVLLLIVGAIGAVNTLVTREEPARPVRAVDYRGQLDAARDLADYRVLAPRGLGAGWVPTSVDLQSSGGGVRWHLGFLSPRRQYVGLEQADVETDEMTRTYVGDLAPSGNVSVGGQRWRLYRGETDTALVRRTGGAGGAVTVVVGTAAPEVLRDFAASLR